MAVQGSCPLEVHTQLVLGSWKSIWRNCIIRIAMHLFAPHMLIRTLKSVNNSTSTGAAHAVIEWAAAYSDVAERNL